MRRYWLCGAALVLLLLALVRTAPLPAGQAAVPLSFPGQENMSFWVNHGGLEQIDAEGEAGFGDMARLLLRRRSNAPLIRPLRDRFTFKVKDPAALDTPDLFRVDISGGRPVWRHRPEQFVIAAGHTFNLPLVIRNLDAGAAAVDIRFEATTSKDALPPANIAGNRASSYFLRVVETEPGARAGKLFVRCGASQIEAPVSFDVRPLVNLRVKLVDDDGRPAAARVYLTGSDGLAYAPPGSITRILAMSADYFFHAEDSFEMEMPAGDTLIEVTRGLEYRLRRQTVRLEPGKPSEVRLRLERWDNLASKGWYSADAHIHCNYTSPHHQVITVDDIRLQALAEDLNNANLMVANSEGGFLHDAQYFEGKPNAASTPGHILYWNEEFRNRGLFGHMSFFNLKTLVIPAYTGFPGTPYPENYPPNYALAENAQKQGGAVTYVHPSYVPDFGGSSAHELPVDLALGQVDAMDVLSNDDEPASMALWYRLLNCGFRLAISAGTDSFTNVADHYIPGGGRVYVHSGSPLRYDSWVREYKRGRTFATNGPMLQFTVNGKEPGDEIRLAATAAAKVRVTATLHSMVPVDQLEIVANGRVVASKPAAGKTELTLATEVSLPDSAWIAARALGPWDRMIVNDLQAFAHTSPVYVYLGGRPIASPEDARFWSAWISQLMDRVAKDTKFLSEAHRQEVLKLFERALEIYRKLERKS